MIFLFLLYKFVCFFWSKSSFDDFFASYIDVLHPTPLRRLSYIGQTLVCPLNKNNNNNNNHYNYFYQAFSLTLGGNNRSVSDGRSHNLSFDFGRQRGRVVRAPDLKSGGHGFKSHSDHLAGVVSWWTLVQLLCHACI